MKRAIFIFIVFFSISCGYNNGFIPCLDCEGMPSQDYSSDEDVIFGDVSEIQGTIYENGQLMDDVPNCYNTTITSILCMDPDNSNCLFFTDKPCSDHKDCDDGIYCNEPSYCGFLKPGEAKCFYECCPAIPPDPPCKTPCYADSTENPENDCNPLICIEELKQCIPSETKDTDHDGFADMNCGGNDCDDKNDKIHPSMLDVCDGIDNNCNGLTDEEGWTGSEKTFSRNPLNLNNSRVSLHTISSFDNKWLIAWLENQSIIKFLIIDSNGEIIETEEQRLENNSSAVGNLSIATIDNNHYLFWTETNSTGNGIYASIPGNDPIPIYRISAEESEEIRGIKIVEINEPRTSLKGGIFFTQAGDASSQLNYLPISSLPPLIPDSPTTIESNGRPANPDAVWINNKFLVAWDKETTGGREIFITIFNPTENPLSFDPIALSSNPSESIKPRIACDTENSCQIAWLDRIFGPFEIFVVPFLVEIQSPSSGPVSITSPPEVAYEHSLAFLSSRNQFLTLYTLISHPGNENIYFNFISLDAKSFSEPQCGGFSENIKSNEPAFAIDRNANSFAILFKEYEVNDFSGKLYFRIFSCL